MRPGQKNRMRGRSSGRKGPNPLTRSYESNGPDVKIRGTAQHVAEKYLQLARDSQVSGDIVMAESLLQHAEHYFRLIAAAQAAQQVNGFGRPMTEAEVDLDDDDFEALPDRFASLSERLPPPPAFQAQPQAFAPAPQPHFAPPQQQQPQPQPFEERPIPEMRQPDMRQRDGRPERGERPPRPERPQYGRDRNFEPRERNQEGGDRPRPNYDRNRDQRFNRNEPAAEAGAAPGLPSFITAPTPNRAPFAQAETAPEGVEADRPGADSEGVNFHLSSRRRRRPRPPMDEAAGSEAPETGELPIEPERF